MMRVCDHPLSDLVIAGEAAHPLSSAFHTLLQTISDLMLLLPPGKKFSMKKKLITIKYSIQLL